MLMNVEMPTIVGILTFISGINFMLRTSDENKQTDANFMGRCPTELAQSGTFGNLMSNGAKMRSWQKAV